MDIMIASLLNWLVENTDLPQRDTMPHVVVVDQVILQTIANEHHRKVYAVCYGGDVVIGKDIDQSDIVGRSIVVHELVHWRQTLCQGVATIEERDKLEGEAIIIQNYFLREKGSNVQFRTNGNFARLRVKKPETKCGYHCGS